MAARTVASVDSASLDLTDNPPGGLQIIDTVAGGSIDNTGIVKFRATYLVPGVGVKRSGHGSFARAVAGSASAR